ncbi:MAG: hypothetical protein MN733_38715, partial [Nitrososphaera sp.]|nr:hypothetical protein [Nitrososphaera sp.]
GLIKVGSAKMSGSLGNYIRVSDLMKRFSGDVLRLFVLSTHYRSPFDIGIIKDGIPSALAITQSSYGTFTRLAERIKEITKREFYNAEFVAPTADFADIERRFLECLSDDFNTAKAIGVVYELCNRMNRLADRYKLNTSTPEGIGEFSQGAHVFKLMMNVLGLTLKPFVPQRDLNEELIRLLVAIRTNLKAEATSLTSGNSCKLVLFNQTDFIRGRLRELGVAIDDTPSGSTWRIV